jgi:hypothetical protein
MPTNPLFDAADLTIPLGREISNDKAEHAERIVWGWLKGPLGLTDRPDPTPDEIFSWAVELGSIYIRNPSGLSSHQLGPAQQAFSSDRRNEILAGASGVATSSLRPQGSFPDALRYPDPAW